MSEKAHVTSVEALELFRASLIVYQSKARPTLDQVKNDALRLKDWLQYDREVYWKNQIRRRQKVLEEAQNALFTAKMSNPAGVPDAEQMMFRRAKRAMEEAETKLKRVRRWLRDFEHEVDPLLKRLERLQNVLSTDMPRALTSLAQMVKTLVEYAGSAFGQTQGLTGTAPGPGGESPVHQETDSEHAPLSPEPKDPDQHQPTDP